MSDLISRSNLIMRLCDYALQESPNDNESEGEQRISKMIYEVIQNCIACVEEQPTAYDVDKVVEELECDRCENCSFLEVCAGSKYCTECHNKAIEIVKQGGVYDDVCEWKSTQINNEWNPSCEPNSTYNVFGVAWFRKCPYCGKMIKAVK